MDLILIDGNNILVRSHYGRAEVLDPTGRPIQGIAGVVNTVLHHYLKSKSSQIVICWDAPGKTFRHELYPEYKANRNAHPQELLDQIVRAKKALENLGLCQIEVAGYEADDCIGTLAYQSTQENKIVSIVSGDRDLWQLISRNVFVEYWPIKKPKKLFTLQSFSEQFQIDPGQIIDYKALVGDASDNIPGVPGIGDKTVWPLLQQGLTLKDLLVKPDLLKPSQAKKLEQYKEQALMCRKLVTLACNISLTLPEKRINIRSDIARLTLRTLGFHQMSA
ncbi:5'-3' exonuclease [Desulfitobacterium sp. AusDCA]|uniref:5'-3' exonuclease n=1 Tax=Desulfitobacterium sp. AusDCA TaxID=3240383 RepID=UPI003DA70420